MYTLMVLTMFCVVGAIACFVVDFFSPMGKNMRVYQSDMYQWKKENIVDRMSNMFMSYKIMPVTDPLRNRDMLILQHQTKAIPTDEKAV